MTDIRKTLDEGSMTSFQWLAVAICTMLIMLDGFDVLVMAFTASAVAAEWKLNGAQLGVLFSSGLLGMAAGSLFIAPLADRWGRQAVIVLCLVVVSAGMLASALAHSHIELAALRAITGVGIGGMLASVGVIAAEYSSFKWRSTSVALQATGYPIGATLGGLMAAWLLTHHGWRSVFVFGGVATALMLPVVLWKLPESVDFLLDRRPAGALDKLNRLLARMGRAPVQEPPARATGQAVDGNTVDALQCGTGVGVPLLDQQRGALRDAWGQLMVARTTAFARDEAASTFAAVPLHKPLELAPADAQPLCCLTRAKHAVDDRLHGLQTVGFAH